MRLRKCVVNFNLNSYMELMATVLESAVLEDSQKLFYENCFFPILLSGTNQHEKVQQISSFPSLHLSYFPCAAFWVASLALLTFQSQFFLQSSLICSFIIYLIFKFSSILRNYICFCFKSTWSFFIVSGSLLIFLQFYVCSNIETLDSVSVSAHFHLQWLVFLGFLFFVFSSELPI